LAHPLHTKLQSQLFITLLHVYTITILTRQYSIPFSHSLHNILDIFTFQIKPSIHQLHLLHIRTSRNGLLSRTHSSNSSLRTDFLDIPVPLIKTLNRTSVTVAWKGCLLIRIAATSQVRGVLRLSRKHEGHVIFLYSCCRVTSSWHVA
jgi:hypothetical protein